MPPSTIGQARGTPGGRGSSRRWWRGSGACRCGRPASTDPRERTFFCAVSLLSIESRLPALIADEEARPPHARDVVGRVPVAAAR